MLEPKDDAVGQSAASQTDPPDAPEIEQAAPAWGIETDYWDIWGKQHHASAQLETAILQSLGVDLGSKASLQAAIERRKHRQWRSPLAPTIILTADGPNEVAVSLPAKLADSRATLRIRKEDGSAVELEIALAEAPVTESVELDSRPMVGKRVRLPPPFPWDITSCRSSCPGRPRLPRA
jgi:hypothetical protein